MTSNGNPTLAYLLSDTREIIAPGAELLFYEIRLRSLRVQASLLPLAGTNFAPFVGTKGEKEIELMRE